MKKILLTSVLLGTVLAMQAQDTYLNDQMTNTSGDVYGTARFVGMGGAMGALGADISTISWNPAGIGLLRKSEIGFTAGAIWDSKGVNGINRAHATLDQMGGVCSFRTGNDKMPYLNVAFNYQKKKNFNNAFIADNDHLNGLSQMTQLADLVNAGYDTDHNLAGWAVDNLYLTPLYKDANGVLTPQQPHEGAEPSQYVNKYQGELNRYTQKTWGSLNAFDFNLSGNVKDRCYWGFTLGIDQLRYRAQNDYYEESSCQEDGQLKLGDYSLYNDREIDGVGVNMKFGVIFRPIESNSFRIGLTLETPTWYVLKSSTLYQLTDHVGNTATDMPESYLEYSIRTPWKFRAGMGSTAGNFLAWDVDYEYAHWGRTAMGYPNDYADDAGFFDNTWDLDMNEQTKRTLKGTHNVRAGIEVKPTKKLALRLGYNFASSSYKDQPAFDQYGLDSYAMNYSTSTSYMKVGELNSLTLGLGYRWKCAYLDMAYKVSRQKADFYGFYEPTDANRFHTPNRLTPTEADLSRQQLTATLGFRF